MRLLPLMLEYFEYLSILYFIIKIQIVKLNIFKDSIYKVYSTKPREDL